MCTLGVLQPEVVKDLVTSGLLVEEISFDFQSSCLYSEDFVPARESNLSLLEDDGLFAAYENEYSCLQLVRNFYVESTLSDGLINGESGTGTPVTSPRGCNDISYLIFSLSVRFNIFKQQLSVRRLFCVSYSRDECIPAPA